MKKNLVFLFCFLSLLSFAQVKVPRASKALTVEDQRLIAALNLVMPRYNDTAQANLNKGLDSCGAIIFIRSTGDIYKRTCSPKAWVKVVAAGGGGSGSGSVTSVGLTMPSAFTVTGSPVTDAGTLSVSAAGTTSQYIRGNGTLATLPLIPSVVSYFTNDAGYITSTALAPYITSATAAATYQPIGSYAQTTGNYSNPTWINSLAWSKITGVPTPLSLVSGTNTGDETTARINALYGFGITNPNLQLNLSDSAAMLSPYLRIAVANTLFASLSHTHTFASLTSKPTTISGYGITDAFTQSTADGLYAAISHTHTFASLTSKPTTLAGYGITDAATATALATTNGNVSTNASAIAALPTASSTTTFTNKRITQRVATTSSSSTITPDADGNDLYTVTALAVNATIAAPTGTPTEGQSLLIRIKDNGTTRTLTWNSIFRASTDFALPTATVVSKTMYIQFIYNATDSKYDAVGLTSGF